MATFLSLSDQASIHRLTASSTKNTWPISETTPAAAVTAADSSKGALASSAMSNPRPRKSFRSPSMPSTSAAGPVSSSAISGPGSASSGYSPSDPQPASSSGSSTSDERRTTPGATSLAGSALWSRASRRMAVR